MEKSKPKYLWAAHGDLRRISDNISVIAQELDKVYEELQEIENFHALPEDAKVADLTVKIAEIQSELTDLSITSNEKTENLEHAILEGGV